MGLYLIFSWSKLHEDKSWAKLSGSGENINFTLMALLSNLNSLALIDCGLRLNGPILPYPLKEKITIIDDKIVMEQERYIPHFNALYKIMYLWTL